MTQHTFESLKDAPISDLRRIKDGKRLEFAKERQKRWDIIASILFYQSEIKKLNTCAEQTND